MRRDGSKKSEEALQAGMRLSAARPEVAQQAALMLVSQDRMKEALALLERASGAAPASADLALMRAIVLGMMGRIAEADQALKEIESRWPEWDRPYLAHGLLLEGAGRKAEGKRKMQTALELNPQGAQCGAGLRALLFPLARVDEDARSHFVRGAGSGGCGAGCGASRRESRSTIRSRDRSSRLISRRRRFCGAMRRRGAGVAD